MVCSVIWSNKQEIRQIGTKYSKLCMHILSLNSRPHNVLGNSGAWLQTPPEIATKKNTLSN